MVKVTRSKEIADTRSRIAKDSDAKGLRYEIKVSNYFRARGCNPKIRAKKYGFEYDIYDKKSGMLSTEYLVVECKCQDRVSARDVVRFIHKVDVLYRHLPEGMFGKPQLNAYLCHSEDIDQDAAAVAMSHNPSVKLLNIEA